MPENNGDSKLKDELGNVVKGQNELLNILKKNESKGKSKWEITYEIFRFIFVVIVPSIGVVFGLIFTNIQTKNAQVLTVEKFMPYLTGNDEKAKSIALLAISALGNEELAVKLGKIVKGTGSIFASSRIATSAPTVKIREYAKKSVEESINSSINKMVATTDGDRVFMSTPQSIYRVTTGELKLFPEDKFKQFPKDDISLKLYNENIDGSILVGSSTANATIDTQSFYRIQGDDVLSVPKNQITFSSEGDVTFGNETATTRSDGQIFNVDK